MPWTGAHNTGTISESWTRKGTRDGTQTVSLGLARFSQELLTMIVKGMHYAGVLSPTNTTVVKDAKLYHHMDMDCPEVVITPEHAIMKQHNVVMQLKCRDQILNNGSNYTLIDSVFSNATQDLSVGAYVAPDHSALGFYFQLHNASLATANVTAFNSTSFFSSKEMLQQMAQGAIQGSLPPINKLLKRSPVVLCGGGTSSCSLVPFVDASSNRTSFGICNKTMPTICLKTKMQIANCVDSENAEKIVY